MTLSDKIKSIRDALGLTQQEFAEKLEVSQGAITSLESGRNKDISMRVFRGLVFQLNVNPYYILSDSNQEPIFAAKDSGTGALRKKIKLYEDLLSKMEKVRLSLPGS